MTAKLAALIAKHGSTPTVAAILEDFGWEPADIGSIERSRALEEMCLAWTYYGFERGSWDHAFKMLHR